MWYIFVKSINIGPVIWHIFKITNHWSIFFWKYWFIFKSLFDWHRSIDYRFALSIRPPVQTTTKLCRLFLLWRFLAIVLPLRHMSWCRGGYLTVRRVLIICLLVWGLAAFAAYTRESTVYSLFAIFKSPVWSAIQQIFFPRLFLPHSFISVFLLFKNLHPIPILTVSF